MSSSQNQPKQFPNINAIDLSKPPQWLIIVGAVFGGLFLLCCGCPLVTALVMPSPELQQEHAAAPSMSEADLARKQAGQEAKRQKELADKARAEPDAAKAAEDRQARLRKHLDNFKFLLAAHAPGSEKIIRHFKVETMGIEIESMEITVANDWHVQPYQIRLQMAQNLWNTWVKASDKKEKPDTARIKIVDLNGNEVGGSRLIAGSSIWVQEK